MTPQEEIQVRQMIANQMSARQPMLRDQMPDMNPAPRMTIATPEAEKAEYRRQRTTLENAARFKGLLGNTPTPDPTTNYRPPYSREEIERLMRDEEAQRLGLRPPTDAERARLDANSQVNPEMPLNDLARARLEAERPFNPDDPIAYTGGSRFFDESAPYNPNYGIRPPETVAEYYRRMGINPGRPMDGSPPMLPPGFDVRPPPPINPINPYPPGFDVRPPPPINPINPYPPNNIWQGWLKGGTPLMGINPGTPLLGGEMAADPEPEEYDGFVDSGTGKRGFMGDKYMPTPMDTSVAMAQAAPVSTAYNAPPALALSDPEEYDRRIQAYYRRPVAEGELRPQDAILSAADVVARNAPVSTAYNAPPVASTAYMPPPTAAPVNTAYMPPPTDAPVNTAYMPSRRTVPVDTTYRPPAQANTTYMPSPSPSYGMSTTPTYNMSTSTTPTYGTSNGGQRREPSFSPNQAGKYKVDGPRLRNTGGLFNDLNAFFGRPQT